MLFINLLGLYKNGESCSSVIQKLCKQKSFINSKERYSVRDLSKLKSDFEMLKAAAASVVRNQTVRAADKDFVLDRLEQIGLKVVSNGVTSFEGNQVLLNQSDLKYGRLEDLRILAHELGHFFELCNLKKSWFDVESVRSTIREIEGRGIEPIPGIIVPQQSERVAYDCLSNAILPYGNLEGKGLWIEAHKILTSQCADVAKPFVKISPFADSPNGIFEPTESCYDKHIANIVTRAYGYLSMSAHQKKKFLRNSKRDNCEASFPSEWFADVIGAQIFLELLATQSPSSIKFEGLFAGMCEGLQKPQFGYPSFSTRINIFASRLTDLRILQCKLDAPSACQAGVNE